MTSPRKRKTTFVSVNLTEPARDTLRDATLTLTTPAGRRLSMSDTLIAVCAVALNHQSELLATLTPPD